MDKINLVHSKPHTTNASGGTIKCFYGSPRVMAQISLRVSESVKIQEITLCFMDDFSASVC